MPVKEMLGEQITQTQEQRNYGVLRSWFPRWVWNTACNFEFIKDEFEAGHPYSLAEKQKKFNGPAVIVGAGPSFDTAAPFLKDWKGAVFCPESMAKTCLGWGRQPEYIGLFDAGMIYHFFDGINWKGSTLVTHPAVNPKTLRTWKWAKIYYIMMHFAAVDFDWIEKNKNDMTLNDLVKFVKDQTFGSDYFEHINPILFPFVKAMILNAGCVVNNMVQVAHFMGYDPLFLVGVDFGYPNDMTRAKPWEIPRRLPLEPKFIWEKRWKLGAAPPVSWIPKERLSHISQNGIMTSEEQIEYKIALLSIYKIDKPQVFDCSDGILQEFIKKVFKEVVERNGRGYESEYRGNEEIVRICDDYFNSQKRIPIERDVNRAGEKVRDTIGAGNGGSKKGNPEEGREEKGG